MAWAKYSFDLHPEISGHRRKVSKPYFRNSPKLKSDSVSTVQKKTWGSKRLKRQIYQGVHGNKVFVEMVKHILL